MVWQRLGILAVCLCALPAAAAADAVKPRFVILVDTSGSMAQNAAQVPVHGDGSREHPGCDLDNNGKYDDSKLYQAKAALNDTLVAFGSAEFALARYRQAELGQPCQNVAQCQMLGQGANVCVDGRCALHISSGSPDYNECTAGRGCERCADPDNDPTHVFYSGGTCCPAGGPTSAGYGLAGDVVVPFPSGASNLSDLFMWIDGREDFPIGGNKELRASATTPIGGSLNAVRDWLVSNASAVGPAPGIVNRDDKIGCRSYNVILITDGLEVQNCVNNCRINAARAAELLFHSCSNGGAWDSADARCEIAGSPEGTREVRVRTWVVGYNFDDPQLNSVAAAGGTGTALLANNQAELTARLGDIISASLAAERCDCQDNTCDGEVDESFTSKGEACTVGIGRCKRKGVLGCKADGSGLTCSSSPAGVCPASELAPGAPAQEECGIVAGCEAPTPEDCADDDCDGLVDENMSCSCAAKPETCNGMDDDCNGKVDDVSSVRCGLEIGECRPGTLSCADDGQGGKRPVCVGATEPTAEICDGKDNDCDGLIDSFGLACFPAGATGCKLGGAALSCEAAPMDRWTCQGTCRPGLITCSDGRCGPCSGAVTAGAELACDGLDNDCDGEADEGFGLGEPCGPGQSGKGACRPGVQMCADGALKCVGGTGPVDETCNGVDDDCDGELDNLAGRCGLERGDCRPGRWRCQEDVAYCEQPQGPKAELCDGRDNDCDGEVDETPTDPELLTETTCGSNVGVCRPGVVRCVGGGKHCEGGVEPSPESCNGLDDDCDGASDDGINPPGPCPAPGLPAGAPVRGECRPGQNVCVAGDSGATWRCVGGVGPDAEICDGKDNDCDGDIDDGASCPANQGCADGECVLRCTVDADCPTGRLCRDGLCRYAQCVLQPCPPGFRCDLRRGCVDRCEDVKCPTGSRCENGECTGCVVRGCRPGEICRDERCIPNPCLGKACPSGQYCRGGACVRTCLGVTCDDGRVCRDGACVADRCAGQSCPAGQLCDSKDGRCHADPCAAITCLPGMACASARAECIADPCAFTLCPRNLSCRVRADGEAECRAVREVGSMGDGCTTCALGSAGRAGAGPRGGLAGALALLGLGAVLRRRRRG